MTASAIAGGTLRFLRQDMPMLTAVRLARDHDMR